MLDSSSPFYIAPHQPARWRAGCGCSGPPAPRAGSGGHARPARTLHIASADLHDELARDHGERWRFHHDGVLQVYETAAGMSAAAEEAEQARALGVRAQELTEADAKGLFPGLLCDLAGAYLSRRTATSTRCTSPRPWPSWRSAWAQHHP